MDRRHDMVDGADQPAVPSHAELEAALNRSAAQIAAGESVPLEPVLTRLRASADRIRYERRAAERAPTPKA